MATTDPQKASAHTSSTPRSSLSAIKDAARKKKRESSSSEIMMADDPFAPALNSKEKTKGRTGLVFDEFMAQHENPWDEKHVECPKRLLRAKERCDELGLTEKCVTIPTRNASLEELYTCHTTEYIDLLQEITKMPVEQAKKKCIETFHSVYMNEKSFDCALMAAGSCIELTKAICEGRVQNGLALVRPPGHHALVDEACGFCLCNNVAIAAKHALKAKLAERILIVDYDVHHGQATQFEFYDNPDVLYFSIHRYEDGLFWPNLRESNFDYIGGPEGQPSYGKNINVPLNKTGLGDADYLSIFHQILLPIATEFRPDLILVSAGYDAAFGCPEGEMRVSPATYGHIINSLMAFAEGKVGVFFEGGYFIESLAEGVAMTLRALLGEPCLALGALPGPDQALVESVLNVTAFHRFAWECLALQDDFSIKTYDVLTELDCHVPAMVYKGKGLFDATRTGEHYAFHSQSKLDSLNQEMAGMRTKYEVNLKRMSLAERLVALAYDEAMMVHVNGEEPSHPEQPRRIKCIYERLEEFGLLAREELSQIATRKATSEEITLVHDESHFEAMKATVELDQQERYKVAEKFDSIFLNEASFDAALLACGSLLAVVDAVCNEEATRGVAVIRPPGHHAEADEANGFCIFNNVAVAAKYGLEMHSLKRILILDWDVHHGNGIQNMFYNDPRVLYISLHRYDWGSFFPGKVDANHDFVGAGAGQGFNVNIPWNGPGMGDSEYALAFFGLVLPVAYQFNPDLVLISAGFDAARGDPLGGCKLSPEFYGHMTHHLKALANGKVIVALEGGYNLNSISLAMTMVTKALVGDPLPLLAPYKKPVASAVKSVRYAIKAQQPYWSCLKYGVRLPDDISNLKHQMLLKVEEFIKSSGHSPDYIPSQFGAYAASFSVDTLSDIRGVYKKEETNTVESKAIESKNLISSLEKLKLTGERGDNTGDNSVATSEAVAIPISTRDCNVFIPNEYAYWGGQSPGTFTISASSMSSRPVSHTTDSKPKETKE